MIRSIAICIAILMSIFTMSSLVIADDSMQMDSFYSQSVNKGNSPVETIAENVDPFSGNLTAVQTDIHLPGNGGLDLNVVRTYKSGIWGRRSGVVSPGFLLQYEPSPVGVGWSMHMGILRNPRGNGGNNMWLPNNPVFELPDGSQQVFFKDKNNTANFISKDFWTMTVSYPGVNQDVYTITAPDGTAYTAEFGTVNGGYTLYDGRMIGQVTSIKNAAGTATISMTYYKNTIDGMFHLKTITDSVGRMLTFNYNSNKLLDNITVDTRTFYYTYTPMNYSATTFYYLQTFKPPVINAWSYEYDSATNTYQMTGINFPTGGKISYGFTDTAFAVGTTTTSFRVVTSKTTSGRGITGGTWSYAYSSYNSGGSANVTTISAPGVTETHSFYGWGNTGNTNVWKVGLPISKVYSGNITQSESYTWAQGTLISNDPLSSASWSGGSGQVSDSGIYVPFLSAKSITRDGKTYITTNSSFNTYGDPQSISESGDSGGATRSRTLGYWTNTAKNIVKGKPSSESATGSFSGTATSSWLYDSNSGNVTQATKDGVTTNYGYDTNGNLSSVTDANSHSITYLWTNGRISRETNRYYYISRTINSSGTIADETDGRGAGYKTTFLYDGLLRPTSKTPPAGNPISISYPNADGSIRRETRGGYTTDHTFDGFGRPSGSSDSKGVTTTIAYTPYGTKDYEDTNIGDKVSYDYFGRVIEIRHKDNTTITYTYGTTSANKTTITDEKLKNTELTYKAFGNPDEKYLMSVYDAALKTTSYERNIQGNLTKITQWGIIRSFGYDTTKKNFLTTEINQETGTITYGRDNVGNMTSKLDSSGTTTYGYDNINRLTSITVTGNPTGNVISYGYDNANNRTSMIYPGGSAGYAFEAINRMYQKTETINGRTYTSGFGFDGNDNLQTITYPGSRVVTYAYNAKNEVTYVIGFGGSVTSVQHYTTGTYLGLLQSYVLSNGITPSFTYNSRNLTTAITADSALNIGYGYTDPRGNTTSYTNSLDSSKSQAYDYDDLSRLTSFSGAWGSGSFGYDDTGNRSTKSVGGYSTSYAYTNNRVSSTSGQEVASYSYSTEGLLSGGTWDGITHTLNYDKFNNLTSVLAGVTTLASFAYDGDGQRVSKTANGKTTVYHYDLGGKTLSEDDGNGNLIADYIYLNGKLVAKVAAVPVVSATPASASFGNVYVSTTSTAQTVTVRNTGTADLTIGTISITGANSGEFTKNPDSLCGQALAPLASCAVQVSFAPTTIGVKSANLSIPSNDPVTPSINIPLNGIGVLPTISVVKNGTGTGTVTSSPAGINCGLSCSANYTTGTSLTLTATPNSGSTFTGWSGGLCAGTGPCSVTLSGDMATTATFALLPTASFSTTLSSGSAPATATFTDSSANTTSWLWNFGDGTTSTLQNPTHTYRSPGSYTVSLTASNAAGSDIKNGTITVGSCGLPVKVGTTYYATIQVAYDAAAEGDTVQILALDFTENLSAAQSKFVTLDGGYLCGFATNPDTTVLHGAPHLSAGTVKLRNIRISQ